MVAVVVRLRRVLSVTEGTGEHLPIVGVGFWGGGVTTVLGMFQLHDWSEGTPTQTLNLASKVRGHDQLCTGRSEGGE